MKPIKIGPISIMPNYSLYKIADTFINCAIANEEKTTPTTALVITIGKHIAIVWQKGLRNDRTGKD